MRIVVGVGLAFCLSISGYLNCYAEQQPAFSVHAENKKLADCLRTPNLVCKPDSKISEKKLPPKNNALGNFLQNTKVDGNIRVYDFNRDFGAPGIPSRTAFSAGGKLNILTAAILKYFRLGATIYTAQPLGLNNQAPVHRELAMPSFSLTTLGQAFLQFQTDKLLLRAGDQVINTPWMSAADVFMIPAAFQGFYSNYQFNPNLSFTALRMYQFKSRIVDDFTPTNLYNPRNLGDPRFFQLGDTENDGAAAAAMQYHLNNFRTQIWYYQFYDFAKLFYTDATYTFKNSTPWEPFVGAQLGREGGDGKNLLSQFVNGGVADAFIYGFTGGVKFKNIKLFAGYNEIPVNRGSFQNGNIISPYTAGYAFDPLYTTSVLGGLIEKAVGQAYKLNAESWFLQRRLLVTASYAKYYTQPFLPNSNETDYDATYFFRSGLLKGLSIRNRLSLLKGFPGLGLVVDYRFMLQYDFQTWL